MEVIAELKKYGLFQAKQLVMRSYTSTSWSEEVARNWSSWVLEIHIPPNLDSPGGAAVELFSHFPNESEVLLPPMAFLEITKVDDESKVKPINFYFHLFCVVVEEIVDFLN